MTAITFDTHVYVKKLNKAGVPDKQAETHVKVTADIMKEVLVDKFATKEDTLTLKHDLLLSLANLQTTLTVRMGVMIAGGVTIAITLMTIILKIAGVI